MSLTVWRESRDALEFQDCPGIGKKCRVYMICIWVIHPLGQEGLMQAEDEGVIMVCMSARGMSYDQER